MSLTTEIHFGVFAALSYLLAPVMLIWGWIRWTRKSKQRTVPAVLSLCGFILATASALLAISSVAYAQVHHFGFYDPRLMRIFGWGMMLSTAGLLFGISGVWGKSSLRWHSPLAGLGTFAFWVFAAGGE